MSRPDAAGSLQTSLSAGSRDTPAPPDTPRRGLAAGSLPASGIIHNEVDHAVMGSDKKEAETDTSTQNPSNSTLPYFAPCPNSASRVS